MPDNSFKAFETPNVNFRCKYWIHKIDTGKTYTTSFDNTYILYTYETFNTNIEQVEFESIGWKIISLNDPPGKSAYNNYIIAQISDPVGVVKSIYCGYELKGVIIALEKLTHYSKYESWQVFELYEENEKLKSENEKLNTEISDLNLKVNTFQSTPFYTKLLKKYSSLRKSDSAPSKTEITSFIKTNKLNRKFFNLWLKDI